MTSRDDKPKGLTAGPFGALHGIANFLLLCGLVGLVALAGLTCVDVLGRWLFNSPIKGGNDIIRVALPAAIGASIPAVMITRGNITIRMFDRLLPPRATAALDVFAGFVCLVALGAITVMIVERTADLVTSQETTWVIYLPLWPTWVLFSICIAFATLLQLVIFAQDLRALFRPRGTTA